MKKNQNQSFLEIFQVFPPFLFKHAKLCKPPQHFNAAGYKILLFFSQYCHKILKMVPFCFSLLKKVVKLIKMLLPQWIFISWLLKCSEWHHQFSKYLKFSSVWVYSRLRLITIVSMASLTLNYLKLFSNIIHHFKLLQTSLIHLFLVYSNIAFHYV